jgi:hypothetical protein
MESLWQDLQYARRLLIAKPLFAAVTLLPLALGN